MSDNRDPAIKLFGKTIALPPPTQGGAKDDDKGSLTKGISSSSEAEEKEKEEESPNSEGKSDTGGGGSWSDDQEMISDKDQAKGGEEKPALKKPDKILPCPRCNSMDTKFCYYNNYNVNQPRHFCKNCQRYWTAGGTMRNVPVGAGRRKHKNSAASANHFRHLAITEAALQAIPDHQQAIQPNATVLNFGSDMPLCESMATVLNLAGKTMNNCSQNGFHILDEQPPTGTSNSADDLQETAARNGQGPAPRHPLPYMNASPWQYPWNLPPPSVVAPFCSPSFPIPIYPATPYWGCGAWGMPWLAPPLAYSTTISIGSAGSGPNSPTLGKHSRDGNILTKNNSNNSSNSGKQGDKCLWIPKTLRIDDPEEAARSSIWTTLGFKNDKDTGNGFFKSFQTTKEDLSDGHRAPEAAQLQRANPVAFSRSNNFQESS